MAKPGIVLIKRFTYRGTQEEWSNRYHFSGTAPTTPSAWKTLVDAVAAQEKTVLIGDCKIVRAYCYSDTDNDAVATVDYTALGAEIAGQVNGAGGQLAPGDAAMWIRWLTPDKTSKGKPIYLRKYYHGVWLGTATAGNDGILASQKTALTALGTALSNGSISGFTLCGPDGATAGTVAISQYATTRTLKRRGKRPPT